jgi:hypothetical protein
VPDKTPSTTRRATSQVVTVLEQDKAAVAVYAFSKIIFVPYEGHLHKQKDLLLTLTLRKLFCCTYTLRVSLWVLFGVPQNCAQLTCQIMKTIA